MFATGEYEYIETKVEDEFGRPKRMIIDIEFKAQFEVARPTAAYKQLTEALPTVFVGTEESVFRIITILCSAAKQSLRESGLHIPPWRTSTYMQNKYKREEKEEEKEEKGSAFNYRWKPPMVKQRRRLWSGPSALSTQFSNMSINCC